MNFPPNPELQIPPTCKSRHKTRYSAAPKCDRENFSCQGQECKTEQAGKEVKLSLVIRNRTPRHRVNCKDHHALVATSHRKNLYTAEEISRKDRGCQGAQMIRESKQALPARIFTHDVNAKEPQPKDCNSQMVMHPKALVDKCSTSKLRVFHLPTLAYINMKRFPGSIFLSWLNSKALITGSSGKRATKK